MLHLLIRRPCVISSRISPRPQLAHRLQWLSRVGVHGNNKVVVFCHLPMIRLFNRIPGKALDRMHPTQIRTTRRLVECVCVCFLYPNRFFHDVELKCFELPLLACNMWLYTLHELYAFLFTPSFLIAVCDVLYKLFS